MVFQFHLGYLAPFVFCLYVSGVEAATFRDGYISQANHDVRVRDSQNAWTKASVNASFSAGSIQTGAESRAELTFRDQTVVRLGDNTALDVGSKNRLIELTTGAILTQVPSGLGVGGTKVKVRNITATATGTTLVIESLPKAYVKFIVLDGTSRLCLRKNTWVTDCVLVRAGQMLIAGPDAKGLPDAVDVDLNRLVETCQFITEFPRLPGQDRLTRAAAVQARNKSHGRFADTNLVIRGRGTLVNITKPGGAAAAKPGSPTPARPATSPQQTPTPRE